MRFYQLNKIVCLTAFACLLGSCSMTRNITEDDPLYTGIKKIAYDNKPTDNESEAQHLDNMKLEMEAALAAAPNGSLFGSSYFRVPWSWRLGVYNTFSDKSSCQMDDQDIRQESCTDEQGQPRPSYLRGTVGVAK